MDTLPDNWLALASLVLILGMKHGFDADHLATIDGLTRFNSRRNPGLARYCGTLFSLGHGAIVVAIALAVGTLADVWQVPEWFEWVGGLISIAFLTLLGAVNLRAVLAAAPGEMVRPAGIKGRFLGRLTEAGHPLLVAAVGALFAFTATRHGGWEHALGLSLLFMLGMLITDGINGLWISRLIARADTVALVASRVMGLVVSAVSLLVAAFGAAKMLSPAVEAWSDGKELAFGFALVCIIAASFLLALRLARRPLPA